ncbi:MAG: hypothetical protein HQL36_11935 [Alphaproteobacteria bacterium]|nr:hypothetical protein [Alphaproteobacteria bacterium]MBF0251227.1 hypothetical protein [Alphaproteobacteria bacterium]
MHGTLDQLPLSDPNGEDPANPRLSHKQRAGAGARTSARKPHHHPVPRVTPKPKARKGRELSKIGMTASLATLVLTGFKILRPMAPAHPIAAIAFLAFTAWHVYENEKVFKGRQPRKD